MTALQDIAVVGAGAAGLAAADTLARAGLRVTLLEARARPGGRAAVDTSLGAPADLGAAWLHFARANPFTRLAREQGFTVVEREPDWGSRGCVAGRRPSADEVAAWQRAMERGYAAIGAAAAAGRDVAVSEVLPDDRHRPRFDAVMTWAVGAESREISTVDLARYDESGPNWSVTEGLGAVVARAAQLLAPGVSCHYGAELLRVDWRGPGVRLHTAEATLRVDAAILTLPTPVLAAADVQFDPPLPARLRAAFEDVPLGVVNKVFFAFAARDLPPEPLFTIGTAASSRTAHYQLRAAGQPLVMAFFGGDLSRELEATGGLAEFARAELASIFGASFVTRIRGELATAWRADRLARGSYSVARPGRADSRAVLAEGWSPRLLYAGEACSATHFGTLPGAWESGVAAARRLLATA